MKLNIWKVSTLVLGSALALVVSTGSVRETAACDMEEAAPVNRSVQLLKVALGRIDSAESQIKAVNTIGDRGGHRAKALAHLTLAMDEVEKGIAVANAPTPRPKPMRPAATTFAVMAD
jgi:hypothetical protein